MIKTYATVDKNNNSIRFKIEKTIINMLDIQNTMPDEVWEIHIARKINKKDLQKELESEQG